MDRIVEKTYLYDFYGELLTEHQKSVYEDVVFNDMSLSEAASEYNVSRQGIHDLIKRCDKILLSYEEKLHLIEQFENQKKMVKKMQQILKKNEVIKEEDRKKLLSLTEEFLNEEN